MTSGAAVVDAARVPPSTVDTTDAQITYHEVGAADAEPLRQLLAGLDARSRYLRWFTGGVDLARAQEWAAHPERFSAVGLMAFAGCEPVGHAVLIPAPGGRGEVAFEVAAAWRRHGIAGSLLRRLIDAATARGLHEVYAEVLVENADMLAVLRESGPHAESTDGAVRTITLPLQLSVSSP